MSPAPQVDPPVRVFAARGMERLIAARVAELRAKGIPFEVIELDKVLGGRCKER